MFTVLLGQCGFCDFSQYNLIKFAPLFEHTTENCSANYLGLICPWTQSGSHSFSLAIIMQTSTERWKKRKKRIEFHWENFNLTLTSTGFVKVHIRDNIYIYIACLFVKFVICRFIEQDTDFFFSLEEKSLHLHFR